ncbi:efflux transporter periplasmic adaptor subunit [Moraxella caviae]|uniref:Efflux transporter periplasmic adaptor subunit n=1 Tax=Moraxella caviae TaxID=34060 RepID=A0A1S9ZXG1_9GAMM|nr:efflux RND transporter periplasmic adaptor subunit [Moraxella caviae]OOR88087.1 efflux transporter periplasmic adaptor subunit [Moraxella caviae]STZ09969.1 Macrolide-specific efflux protein macA precursor [Moraxella caviae]VEW11247.1 Macrolide-specific efflux protein macA precursor [Moraxella caviae]
MTINKPTKTRPAKYIKYTLAALVLVAVALGAYQFFKPKQAAPNYLTAPAVMGDIEDTVMASGKVKPLESVDVGAQVSGEIVKLYVQIGDEVRQGDLIAQISQVEQKNTLANAQVSLDQAKAALVQAQSSLQSSRGNVDSAHATVITRQAELNKAQRNFDRLHGLVEADAISRQEYDDALANVQVAKASLAAAKASLRNAENDVVNAQAAIATQKAAIVKAQNDLNTAEEDLSHTIIRAPISGTVVSITQKQGTTVNANQSAPTIVTLADLSRVRINAQISEADVINITKGLPARFNILGNPEQQYDAVVAGVEPAPETISSTSTTDSAVYYIGYLDVDNTEGKFRIDMTAQVNIIVKSAHNVLTVPSAALSEQDGKTVVRVVGEDGFAKPVEVSTGLNNRVNVEITSGLEAGANVVIGESGGDTPAGGGGNRPPMM